jgi:hypothetical protein
VNVPKEFTELTHDVFISHSAEDKAVVRPLAERRGREQSPFEHRQGEWQQSRYVAM